MQFMLGTGDWISIGNFVTVDDNSNRGATGYLWLSFVLVTVVHALNVGLLHPYGL